MKILLLVFLVLLAYIAYASVKILQARAVGHETVAKAIAYQRTEGTKRVLRDARPLGRDN